jgi:exonuclease SbcD
MSVIILGDPHLGKSSVLGRVGLGSNLNSRLVDQSNLLDWTLEQAVDHQANTIIITGDIFDEPKPLPSVIALFLSWLKACQMHGVQVHLIMGNHDALRSGNHTISPLDVINEANLEHVAVYKDINTIFLDQTAFTLIPFRDRKFFGTSSATEALAILQENLTYELASIPSTYHKVVIGHLAIEKSIPVGDEIDDLTNELFCPIDMFSGYDYVWMGHVHKPQVLHKDRPFVAHIGSMDISNFGETEQTKHIVIFDCQTGKWEQRQLPTRPLKKVSLLIPKDTENPTQYVLDELKMIGDWNKAIVRVEVALAVPELKSINKADIEKYLVAEGVFNVANITETKKVALIKKDDTAAIIDTKMDVASAIKTYAELHIEETLRESYIGLAMDIYAAYKEKPIE